jgi:hypothetical protein
VAAFTVTFPVSMSLKVVPAKFTLADPLSLNVEATIKIDEETNQIVSDYLSGRISQADAQSKAEPLKTRALALKEQTANARALSQCLRDNQ